MAAVHPQAEGPDETYHWVLAHAAAVRGYVFGLVRRPEVADDLSQEVFRRAWQARDRYREQGHPRAYLLTIADRVVCDYARRGRRDGGEVERTLDDDCWRAIEPEAGDATPPEVLLEREMHEELDQALERLSPLQRRVLLLRYYGEMEFAQIAQVVECPLNTVLSHCRRGLLALRKILAET